MKAHGKINLSLDVLGKRDDGYHDMKMVMQSVSLADQVTLEKGSKHSLELESNLSFLPKGKDNLGWKAVTAFYRQLGKTPPPLRIHIQKEIPVCAGLAGGSSDAATVLHLLNSYENMPFSPEMLREISLEVGSDVAFCLLGGTALAQGRGELLQVLPPLPDCHLLLCKPSFGISTPYLFGQLSKCKIKLRPDTAGMEKALEAGDLSGVAQRLFNVFEEALNPHQRKTVEEIKRGMGEEGALGSTMSGSGSTVFGIFSEFAQAQECYERLKTQFPETFLTTAVGN